LASCSHSRFAAGAAFALAAVLTTLLWRPALAQAPVSVTPVDCDPALVQSYAREQLADPKRFALLQLVTRDNYERLKTDNGALAVGGATLGATSGFDDFNDRRQKEFAAAKFRYDVDSSRAWLATSTTAAKLAPYVACLRARPGLTAWIDPERSNQQQATVRVLWRPVKYDGARRLRITWYGNFVDEPIEESTTLVDGEERVFTVRRAFDEPFQADVYLDRAYALVLHIPYAPGTGPSFTPARAAPARKP
jgi:hypothetical protein